MVKSIEQTVGNCTCVAVKDTVINKPELRCNYFTVLVLLINAGTFKLQCKYFKRVVVTDRN